MPAGRRASTSSSRGQTRRTCAGPRARAAPRAHAVPLHAGSGGTSASRASCASPPRCRAVHSEGFGLPALEAHARAARRPSSPPGAPPHRPRAPGPDLHTADDPGPWRTRSPSRSSAGRTCASSPRLRGGSDLGSRRRAHRRPLGGPGVRAPRVLVNGLVLAQPRAGSAPRWKRPSPERHACCEEAAASWCSRPAGREHALPDVTLERASCPMGGLCGPGARRPPSATRSPLADPSTSCMEACPRTAHERRARPPATRRAPRGKRARAGLDAHGPARGGCGGDGLARHRGRAPAPRRADAAHRDPQRRRPPAPRGARAERRVRPRARTPRARKDPLTAIRAWPRPCLPTLLFAGFDKAGTIFHMQREAARLGVLERVRYASPIPDVEPRASTHAARRCSSLALGGLRHPDPRGQARRGPPWRSARSRPTRRSPRRRRRASTRATRPAAPPPCAPRWIRSASPWRRWNRTQPPRRWWTCGPRQPGSARTHA